MMNQIKKVCSMTQTSNGQIVVGSAVLLLGAAHFGKASGITDISLPLVGSLGNVAGLVGVVVGSCILLNRFM